MNKLKTFVNDNAAALFRHTISLFAMLGIGLIAGTLFYAELKATGVEVKENSESVKVIKENFNELVTQQKLLLQGANTEKQLNKDFRKETSQALREILILLPRQGRPR